MSSNHTYLTKSIAFPIADENNQLQRIAKTLQILPQDIVEFYLHKRSIDARNKNDIKIVCSFVVTVKHHIKPKNCTLYTPPVDVLESDSKTCLTKKPSVAVIGAGPCGLFCALLLAKSGVDVTLIEQGQDIDKRQQTVENFLQGKSDLDTHSNVQFGLGGAGTFSDGKLATGISSPLIRSVLNEFVRCGASEDILYSATPHIGTDKLRAVVANMRDKIMSFGGKILFDTKVTDINFVKHGIEVVTADCNNNITVCKYDDIVLAVGHSARDTYKMLASKGLTIEPKPFAIGVRVEHTREFISTAQYGQMAMTHRDLQSANYKLVADKLPSGRSCYSFCMCPGGIVLCSSSERNGVVVNGMSNYDRLADNSNSALVVNVTPQDFENGVLGGVKLQRDIEQACYNATENFAPYSAPAQNVVDFLNKKTSTKLSLKSSYQRGLFACNLWEILPQFVCESIAQGLKIFGNKIKGFDKCGILIAPETRTSSPIKIVRDKENLSSVDNAHIYPAGEGCGYAGGITSASVDGLRVAQKIIEKYSKNC